MNNLNLILLQLLLITCATATILDPAAWCDSLGTSERISLYHRGRCYVHTTNAVAVDWPTAATMCSIENYAGTGGLAMWISKEVFTWMETSSLSDSKWTGMHRLPGTGDEHWSGLCLLVFSGCYQSKKNNFAWGQGPDYMTDLSWPALNDSFGMWPHVSGGYDTFNTAQGYGAVYARSENPTVNGWSDEDNAEEYKHYLCQYESTEVNHIYFGAFRMLSELIAERVAVASVSLCVAQCHAHPLCNSYAYSTLTNDCQIYMVGPDDLGGFFNSWLVTDVTYKMFVRS